MTLQFVKTYVKAQKNDPEALCESSDSENALWLFAISSPN
jgi:hypothetical protein